MSDIDIVVVDSLKALDPKWPIREADMMNCYSTSEKCQSRHNECYDTVADAAPANAVASHRLDDRPILPKESRRFLYVRGIYFDTTCPPSNIVRYLKEERVTDRFPVAAN